MANPAPLQQVLAALGENESRRLRRLFLVASCNPIAIMRTMRVT
jgi:hypothetical protein